MGPLELDDVGSARGRRPACERERARRWLQLVYEKTGGNPFFAIQFLTALADEGLLAFDHDDARLALGHGSDPRQGLHRQRGGSHGGKLSRLPDTHAGRLKQLACLGNSAPTSPRSLWFSGRRRRRSTRLLWEAVRAGLVFRLDGTYTFLHDRVQEAAYALIPENERAAAHLRIGRLLAARTPPEELEEKSSRSSINSIAARR